MIFVQLVTQYNKAGQFCIGKEYVAEYMGENITLKVNEREFNLCGADTATFVKEIEKLHIENMADDYSRGGPVFLKWQLDLYCDGKIKAITGTNSVPKQAARVIDVFHFFTEDYPTQPDMLHEAVLFATQAHKGQVRKGTDIPYITHPLEVRQILTEMKAGVELKIAGVLHDVAEDTDTSLDEIETKFGKEVARLVSSHTEDKSKSWTERKQAAIERVKTGDVQVAMLIMADKISNLKSMLSDYLVVGEKLWRRFGSSKQQQSRHNQRLINALYYLKFNENTAHMYDVMVEMYEELYADFYMGQDCVYYDKCAVGKGVFLRSEMKWQDVEEIPQNLKKISRRKADRLMALWREIDG